jgi:hypothetical protein
VTAPPPHRGTSSLFPGCLPDCSVNTA